MILDPAISVSSLFDVAKITFLKNKKIIALPEQQILFLFVEVIKCTI